MDENKQMWEDLSTKINEEYYNKWDSILDH